MKKLFLKTLYWHWICLVNGLQKGLLIRLGLYNKYKAYWIKRRIGHCVSCGHCCWDWNNMERCKNYDEENHRCKIHNSCERPQHCIDAPINPIEVEICKCQGYSFKKRR